MFRIRYRIVMEDVMDELKTADVNTLQREYHQILGYIEVEFGEHREGGEYHENSLRENEFGDEIIDYWLEGFLDVVNCFEKGMFYAAFMEIDNPGRWLEFKRIDQKVVINVATNYEEKSHHNFFLTDQLNVFMYEEPLDVTVCYAEFKKEVIKAAQQFLEEIEKINPKLLKIKMSIRMLDMLNEIKI